MESKKHSKSCFREQHLEKRHHLNIQQIYIQCAKAGKEHG